MPNFEEDFEKSGDGKISVLVVEPMKEPYTQEIDNGLASLQKAVGGDIEAVYPYEDQVALVCNEEGKLNGLQLNRALLDEDGDVYDIIAGTFLVTGLTEDNFGSLSPELQQKYSEQFKQPEMFARMNGKIVVIPADAEQEQSQKRTLDIYQLKDDEIGKKMSFMNFDYLKSFNMAINAERYNKVYSGDMKGGEDLEGVYARFNLNHPADYRGHSLSVSDVIVVHENGKDSAHYVDSYGFKELPDFFQTKERLIDATTQGLAVAGHIGTWHVIDETMVEDKAFFLLEHDTYGDEAASIIVDAKGKLVLDEIYNGFDDETLEQIKLDQLSISNPPDTSITTDEMKEYGYAWGGMLPMREEAATTVLEKSGCEVFKLYADNSESRVNDAAEIAEHAKRGGLFGIEKEAWVAAVEKENHLKNAELQVEDDFGMIDGIINNGKKEEPVSEKPGKSSVMDRLKEAKAEKTPAKAAPAKAKVGELEI